MALSDLIVRLKADVGDFTAKWAGVQRELNNAARGAVASTSGFRALGDVITRAGAAATAGLTLPLVAGAAAALKASANIERATVAFTRFTGSARASQQFIKGLQDIADKSDLTFTDLIQGSRRVTTFAKDANDATNTVRILTDAIAGTAGTAENFDRIALALQQISAKGKLSAEELNQIGDAGVQVQAGLAKQLGKTQAEFIKLVRQGLVPADVAIKGILKTLEVDFAGAAAKQAGTLGGIFSTVTDQVQRTAQAVGDSLAPLAKRILTEFVTPALAGIKDLARGFAELDPATQNAAIALAVVAAAAGPILLVLGQLATGFSALASVLRLVPFGVIASSAVTFATSLQGSLIPALQGVRLTALGASVAIAGIGAAATLAIPALIELISAWRGASAAQADAAQAAKDADTALAITRTTIIQRGGDVRQLDAEYKRGVIGLAQYERGMRDMLVTLTKQQGPSDKSAKSTAANTDATLKLASAAKQVATVQLPDWFTDVSQNAERATGALGPLSGVLQNLVKEEVFGRNQRALKGLQDALVDFLQAGETFGTKLQLDTAPLDALAAASLRTQLAINAARDAASAPIQIEVTTPGGAGGIFAAAIQEQALLRSEANRLGDVYATVAAQAGGSSAAGRRAYEAWTEAEKKASGTITTGGNQARTAMQEVSTVLTNLNQRIAEAIINWKGFGAVGVAIAKQIGTAITAEIIGKLILTERRMAAVSGALGKVLSKIPGLGKVFGGGTIPTPGTIGGAAGSAAGTVAGSAGSVAGTAGSVASAGAQAGIQATIGLVTGAISAVTGIIGNVLAFKQGKDIARQEVTTRAQLAELQNLRADHWTRFAKWEGEFIPAILKNQQVFGDAHGAYLSRIQGLLELISGGGQLSAAGGGGATVIVQGAGLSIGELADQIARLLNRR